MRSKKKKKRERERGRKNGVSLCPQSIIVSARKQSKTLIGLRSSLLFSILLFNKLTMEVLHTAPDPTSFIPLAEHQSRTPASFYSGPPILYHHSKQCKVVILNTDLHASPVLRSTLLQRSPEGVASAPNGSSRNEETRNEDEVVIDDVDIWVTSEYVR